MKIKPKLNKAKKSSSWEIMEDGGDIPNYLKPKSTDNNGMYNDVWYPQVSNPAWEKYINRQFSDPDIKANLLENNGQLYNKADEMIWHQVPYYSGYSKDIKDTYKGEWDNKANGGLTSSKAKEILRDGTAQGHPLTSKQKRYFGWVTGGKKADGGMQNHGTLNESTGEYEISFNKPNPILTTQKPINRGGKTYIAEEALSEPINLDFKLDRIFNPPQQIRNLQSSNPDLLQGNNQQLEFNPIGYTKGSYFTRPRQSQEVGSDLEYFDKITGKKLYAGGGEIDNTSINTFRKLRPEEQSRTFKTNQIRPSVATGAIEESASPLDLIGTGLLGDLGKGLLKTGVKEVVEHPNIVNSLKGIKGLEGMSDQQLLEGFKRLSKDVENPSNIEDFENAIGSGDPNGYINRISSQNKRDLSDFDSFEKSYQRLKDNKRFGEQTAYEIQGNVKREAQQFDLNNLMKGRVTPSNTKEANLVDKYAPITNPTDMVPINKGGTLHPLSETKINFSKDYIPHYPKQMLMNYKDEIGINPEDISKLSNEEATKLVSQYIKKRNLRNMPYLKNQLFNAPQLKPTDFTYQANANGGIINNNKWTIYED